MANNNVQDAKSKVQDTAHKTADQARDVASDAADKARGLASDVADKARGLAGDVSDAARSAAHAAGRTVENATSSAASGLESMGAQVREYGPAKGMLGGATESVASTLEKGGEYLKNEGLTGMADDLTEMIKKNPIPALLVGIGVGFMIARLTNSRS